MAKTIAVAEETSTGLQQLKSLPERISSFLKDVRSEMRKVITPSRAEVQATTTVVIVRDFWSSASRVLIQANCPGSKVLPLALSREMKSIPSFMTQW